MNDRENELNGKLIDEDNLELFPALVKFIALGSAACFVIGLIILGLM